jgi:phage terminase large subunit-like protein
LTKKALSPLQEQRLERKRQAEASLESFIELIHPRRLLGHIHREVLSWWTSSRAKTHQLLLLPRDHQKSAMIAYRVAWELTKDPTLRILYISSTSNLAVKQLKFIKDILTSDVYRMYWPEMVNKDESKREKWTEREISVDHPLRAEWSIRDPSVFTAGLTSNIVGMHCDVAVLDDVIVQGNAYTDEGREKVKEQYSYLSSIESVNAREWVVGTRYHPLDLYSDLIAMEVEEYDDLGSIISKNPLFEVFGDGDVRKIMVESIGDGTGEFLWPRQQGRDGKWFGFDQEVLAKKRAQYINKVHFRAQYYNDPHDVDSSPIKRELFQYYDQRHLYQSNGRWFFKEQRLNTVAAVDFAFSLGKQADYSAIVVIGVDGQQNYYILDIDRFRTDKHSDYFKRILKLYEKWSFRKLRAEVNVAQAVLVKDLQENYIRKEGLSLVVEEFRPSRWQGSKEERIMATLEPKYANRQIWHYLHGNCQLLEEELIFMNPPHDDIKDALASAIDFAIPPTNLRSMKEQTTNIVAYHTRFGGII